MHVHVRARARARFRVYVRVHVRMRVRVRFWHEWGLGVLENEAYMGEEEMEAREGQRRARLNGSEVGAGQKSF